MERDRPQTYYIAQASTDPQSPLLVLHFEKRSEGRSPGSMAFPWKDSLHVMVHVEDEKYAVDLPDIYREATGLLERVRTMRGS